MSVIIGWGMIAVFFSALIWMLCRVIPAKEVFLMSVGTFAATGFLFVAFKLIGVDA